MEGLGRMTRPQALARRLFGFLWDFLRRSKPAFSRRLRHGRGRRTLNILQPGVIPINGGGFVFWEGHSVFLSLSLATLCFGEDSCAYMQYMEWPAVIRFLAVG